MGDFDFLMDKKQAADSELASKKKRVNDFQKAILVFYNQIEEWLKEPIQAKAVSLSNDDIDIEEGQGGFITKALSIATPDKHIIFMPRGVYWNGNGEGNIIVRSTFKDKHLEGRIEIGLDYKQKENNMFRDKTEITKDNFVQLMK